MYYLPGTRWYIAELIEEISVDGFPRQIIQRNARFIFAHSPEEAYEQALVLGNDGHTDENVARTRYWGLAHLNIVQEDLRPAEEHLAPAALPPMFQIAGWAAVIDNPASMASD